MREIKFRIFLGGVFRYWGFIDDSFVGMPQDSTESFSLKQLKERSKQYTGLKDKNGKEIYEGDIVKYQRYSTENEEVSVKPVVFIEGQFGCGRAFDFHGFTNAVIEVIGNIYENKDLLL